MSKVKNKISKKQELKGSKEPDFALNKKNYILIAIGFAIIVIGFILMSGSENIYGFRKTTLSVIVVIFGFIFEIYAIMKK